MTVWVQSGKDVLGSSSREVTLLAGNQWLSQPPGLAYELLTSFVMPIDPTTERLLHEAAEILAAGTGHRRCWCWSTVNSDVGASGGPP